MNSECFSCAFLVHWVSVWNACVLRCVSFFQTLWTVAHLASLSRQEYWTNTGYYSPDKNTGMDILSFSRRSSQTKNGAHISCICIGRQILYCWTTWEAHVLNSCERKDLVPALLKVSLMGTKKKKKKKGSTTHTNRITNHCWNQKVVFNRRCQYFYR